MKKMRMKKSRRKFLKKMGVIAGTALVPGLALEDALATPISPDSPVPKKKKAAAKKKKVAVKKKAAPKKKKATTKKKVAARKKAAPKRKKAAPKRKKVAVKRRVASYTNEYTPLEQRASTRGVPEPSTVGLVSVGVAAVALADRLRKKGPDKKD